MKVIDFSFDCQTVEFIFIILKNHNKLYKNI